MNEQEKQANYALANELLSEQNFSAAVLAGAVAALLAAAAYGITVAIWPVAYGFAAAGVGIAVGLPMGFLGRGISTKFAVAAALFTVVSAVLGTLFRSMLAERSLYDASPVDLVYWFVALFCAVFLARRSLSRAERLAIGLLELKNQDASTE